MQIPQKGEYYVDKYGELHEVYYASLNYVELFHISVTGNTGPVFSISLSSFVRDYSLPHNSVFPLGGGLQAAQKQLQSMPSIPLDAPLPPGQSNEFFGVSMKPNKCTCGIDSIGGGKHSDWCDKKEEAK